MSAAPARPSPRRCGWAGWSCPPGSPTPSPSRRPWTTWPSPALEQLAFADLLGGGEVDRHLRRNRARYRARRDALVSALAAHAPQVRVRGIAAGLHVVAELPPQTDEVAGWQWHGAHSVGAYPMRDYRFGDRDTPAALVLGYGGLSEPTIRRGMALFALAIPSG